MEISNSSVSMSEASSKNTWFTINIRRTSSRSDVGCLVKVWADPRIEAFIKSFSEGREYSIADYGGGHWTDLGMPLKLRDVEKLEGRYRNDYGLVGTYDLTHTGIMLDRASNDGRLCLSFLRFIGISEPQGIMFGLTYPMSISYAKQLTQDITAGVSTLVRDYIAPFDINLSIVGRQ
jgi:hypothetical protein